MGYIEYRIDNFGLKKHLPESVKNPMHRTKNMFRNRKKQHIHRIFPAIHFDPGKKNLFRFFDRSMDCCSRLWFKPVPQRGQLRFQHGKCVATRFAGAIAGWTMKKNIFCNEKRGVSQKKWWIFFTGGPILLFYLCSSSRNWVSFMYKSKYHIRNSLWGVATLDVWSS